MVRLLGALEKHTDDEKATYIWSMQKFLCRESAHLQVLRKHASYPASLREVSWNVLDTPINYLLEQEMASEPPWVKNLLSFQYLMIAVSKNQNVSLAADMETAQ